MTLLLSVIIHALPAQDLAQHCVVHKPCTVIYEDRVPRIYMRESGDFQGEYVVSFSLDGITFPHFQSRNRWQWVVVGEEIAKRAALPIDPMHYNQFHTLAHEIKHAQAGGSHLQ